MPVLLLFLLLMAPVRLTVTLDGSLTLDVRVWGIGRRIRPRLPAGQSLPPAARCLRAVRTFLRADHARRLFRRHIHVLSLQALVCPGFANAAHTAVATGLLRLAVPLLPPAFDIRVQPDFVHSARLQARCILFFHLGTIFITAGMVFLAWVRENQIHPAPKEA